MKPSNETKDPEGGKVIVPEVEEESPDEKPKKPERPGILDFYKRQTQNPT